ncbi:MAG: helix-turn-helix transcriptional regulator [Deltaproteobacteria bacterium]|nr:helix-turn-helix transcriptional regulator [Deltaproteobacteria bacterium]
MDSDLTELTGLAYDAVIAPARWADFLAALASALGGASLGMSLRHPCDGHPGWVVFHDADAALARSYAEHFFRVDPFRVRSDALAPGSCEVMAGGTIAAATVERSEFYNDWMRPQGFAPAPSIGLTLGRDSWGEPIGIGVFRPRGARAYGDRELRLLRRLSPHLQRATRAALRLADTENQLSATGDVLEHLPVAAVLLDHEGRLVRANRKASALGERGHPFVAARASLALDPDVVGSLRRIAADSGSEPSVARGAARGSAHGAVAVRRGDDRPPLWLHPVPCSSPGIAGLEGPPGWLWVLIEDPADVPLPSIAALVSMLGLTNAEARLTTLLVAGRRLEQAATELGIAHETARTQLKAAFRKTGARSQTDLVRLVLQRPLLVRRDG